MMYKPKFNIHHEKQDREEIRETLKQGIDEIYNIPTNPVSDTTQFIISSTTIDTHKLRSENRFTENFENEILSIDKFAPLSNIDLTDQLLTRLIWMDMVFAKRMGMTERAQRKSLEIVRLYNESRGRGGFFQDAMITQRQELIAKQQKEEEKRKRLGFFKKKQPQEKQNPYMYNPQENYQ